MSETADGMPSEVALGYMLGRELYALLASSGFTGPILEAASDGIQRKLLSDPNGIIDFVALPADGANGVAFTISICDDFRLALTLSTNDLESVQSSAS